MKTNINTLSVDVLFASPTNPRKKFDPEKMAELVASVREKGIIFPLLVRPVGDRYEIVAGERRWRAAKEIDHPTAPCIVREMTDREVLEDQMIENLQRSDLEPLEEAKGFRLMIDMKAEDGSPIHTAESVAAKIGKSSRHVHRRLKLLNLPEIALAAMEEGTIPTSTGEMLGRIPDAKLREKAVKEVLQPKNYTRPLTRNETQALIERSYMRTLEGSSFDQEDATLHPDGVKCSVCPHRAGNCPDIEGVRGDMCLNPICFERKAKAGFERWKTKQGETDGKRFLSPAENKKSVRGDNLVSWSSNLVALDSPPQDHLLNAKAAGQKIEPWRKLIEGRGVEVIVARKSDDSALECADREKATEAARLNGHNIFKLTNKEERISYEDQQKRDREAKKNRQMLFQALLAKIAGNAGNDQEKWLRLLVAQMVPLKDVREILTARKLSSAKKLIEQIVGAKGAELCDVAAQMSLLHEVNWNYEIGPEGVRVLKAAGIDPKKVKREIEEAEKKKLKPKTQPKPKKPKKADLPKKGKLGDLILGVLRERGDAGATVKDIAEKTGVKPQNVHVWFATMGKRTLNIQKVGVGHFRIRPGKQA